MGSWQVEWAIIRAAIPEWESFLFSKEIFWPLIFEKNFEFGGSIKPRLSAGRLLLAVFLLDFQAEADAQIETAVRNDLRTINELRAEWKSNWQKKLEMEIPARLKQWEENVREIRSGRLSNAEYANQVQVRVILELLAENSTGNLNAQNDARLAAVDTLLKQYSSPGQFVWGEDVMPSFDQHRHWYLFRQI